jgi:aconitate decarboxylase
VFHPPGVVGAIGSAISSAHLLGLDVTQTRNAVGLAASRAGTLIGNIGTMAKCTHCGLAAAMGLDAALMARRGFTANPDIIEASNGLAKAFFNSNWDPQALVITGAPLRIIEPGFAVKMFPSQYATHFVILAALAARARVLGVSSIKTVEIIGPAMPYVDRPKPSTGLDGKFSFQYAAACALLDGKIGIGSFTDERCASADIAAMLPKVRFVQSSEIPASLDQMWVDVKIELASGERIIERCAKPNGAWGKPIPEDEHLAKIRDCMGTVFDGATIENCISTMQRFDMLESADLRTLIHTLGNFDVSDRLRISRHD